MFYARKAVQAKVEPMWVTWGQRLWQDTAQRFEDYGTRNLAEVITLGDAVQFHQHGVVFRPMAAAGWTAVRLSPNFFNSEAEIERFFAAHPGRD